GTARWFSGEIAGAVAELREAARLVPGHAESHYYLGLALLKRGDLQGAAGEQTASQFTPDAAESRHPVNTMGQLPSYDEELDEAIEAFRTAIRLKPDFVDAYSNLGLALVAKRDPDGAIAAFNTAIKLQPGNLVAHHN